MQSFREWDGDSYNIIKLPEGGFIVRHLPFEQGTLATCLFASTSIDAALQFIKGKLTNNG